MTTALEGGERSASRPGRSLPPGKTRYPLHRRLGGSRVGLDRRGKSRSHRDSIPDRPSRSQSVYRLSYRAHHHSRPNTKFRMYKFRTSWDETHREVNGRHVSLPSSLQEFPAGLGFVTIYGENRKHD
jgi:hypothetical protein